MNNVDLKRIKILCAEKGITLAELGRQCNITPSNLTMIIKKNTITVDKLARIADYFGISVGYFFGEEKTRLPLGELRFLLNDFSSIKNKVDNAMNCIRNDIHYLEKNF